MMSKALPYVNSMLPDYTHDDTRGIWLYGDSGCGKSVYARTFEDVYDK